MSADEQLEGLEVPTGPTGTLEAAVRRSLSAASLDERDEGAGELAAQAARFVDLAAGRRDPFAGAATVREAREQLARLRLDPASRLGNDAGQLEKWLEGLATPEAATEAQGHGSG